MKRIFASIGLVAVGASSLHAQYTPGLTASERTKLITLSGSLRGFYDDNFLTQRSELKESSWGLEVSPSITLNKSTSTTLISGSAIYDLKHYTRQDINDHTVQINGLIDHKFTEAQKLKIKDSFVIAQEPSVLDPVVLSTPLRVSGSNIRNTASADYLADLNRLLQIEVTYDATVYHFQDKTFQPLLNRLEQLAGLDLRYKFNPNLTGVLGYHFSDTGFDSEIIPNTVNGSTPNGIPGDSRNNRSHFGLAGFDYKITQTLTASVRGGAEFFDYYNFGKTQTSPYADGSLTYNYATASYLQVGVKHLHNATDIIGSSTDPVLDAESTVAYISVTQPLTFISPNLTAGIYGSYQHSRFNGGGFTSDQNKEDFYDASGNLTYQFNPNFSVEAGYNYDQASSSIRPFERNRVYLGVRATY